MVVADVPGVIVHLTSFGSSAYKWKTVIGFVLDNPDKLSHLPYSARENDFRMFAVPSVCDGGPFKRMSFIVSPISPLPLFTEEGITAPLEPVRVKLFV
jgi:hypothetical protein